MAIEVKVPDIGDFKDVPVITVFVKPGDVVRKDDPLVELESDKATMEVPSPAAGKVASVSVKEGDKVAEGSVILTLEAEGAAAAPASPAAAPAPKAAVAGGDVHGEVVVLGSGPGGYTAAFRAADLGKKVVLIEKDPSLGGVCLNVGCIPSKALLHAAKVISEAEEMGHFGVTFAKPKVDVDGLRGWKESVVKKLTGGLSGLAKGRKVTVVEGVGTFTGPNAIEVKGKDGSEDRHLRPVHHRRRLRAGDAALHPARRPAGHRLDRRARARWHPEADAGHRRRHHRARDGDGLRRDRREDHHRRVHGPDHPRSRRRHRQAALQADREAVRGDPPEVEGDGGEGARRRARGDDGGAERQLLGRLRPRARRRRPPAERQAGRRRESRRHRRRARLHRRRRPAAHQRPPHLRHRRRRRPADARPQGGARGQGRGRGRPPARTASSTPASSRRSPTPTPRSPGSA